MGLGERKVRGQERRELEKARTSALLRCPGRQIFGRHAGMPWLGCSALSAEAAHPANEAATVYETTLQEVTVHSNCQFP